MKKIITFIKEYWCCDWYSFDFLDVLVIVYLLCAIVAYVFPDSDVADIAFAISLCVGLGAAFGFMKWILVGVNIILILLLLIEELVKTLWKQIVRNNSDKKITIQ